MLKALESESDLWVVLEEVRGKGKVIYIEQQKFREVVERLSVEQVKTKELSFMNKQLSRYIHNLAIFSEMDKIRDESGEN
jgi:hypothetical protein